MPQHYERQAYRPPWFARLVGWVRDRVAQKRWEMSDREILYDDTYTDRRWRYGLLSRPPVWGGAPPDYVVFSLREGDARFPYGTIEYARPLTVDELERFGMVDLGPLAGTTHTEG